MRQRQTLEELLDQSGIEQAPTLNAQVSELCETWREHQEKLDATIHQFLRDNKRVCNMVVLMAKAMARIRELSQDPAVLAIINEVAVELHQDEMWSEQNHEN